MRITSTVVESDSGLVPQQPITAAIRSASVLEVPANEIVRGARDTRMSPFGGSEALGEPYLRISPLNMVWKRAGWLVFLFLGEMVTATAMGFFEKEIARAVVLSLFVPLIIFQRRQFGLAGVDARIRALAVGELRLADVFCVVRRELFSGFALGRILGAIGFRRISIWSAFSSIYGLHWLLVAFTVAFALVGVENWLPRVEISYGSSSHPAIATRVHLNA